MQDTNFLYYKTSFRVMPSGWIMVPIGCFLQLELDKEHNGVTTWHQINNLELDGSSQWIKPYDSDYDGE